MTSIEEAFSATHCIYNPDDLTKFHKKITDLPDFDSIHQIALNKKYNVNCKDLIPFGYTKDHLLCMQHIKTNIFYTVNCCKNDPITNAFVCDYLFVNQDPKNAHIIYGDLNGKPKECKLFN